MVTPKVAGDRRETERQRAMEVPAAVCVEYTKPAGATPKLKKEKKYG